jgi:hypothetical protein
MVAGIAAAKDNNIGVLVLLLGQESGLYEFLIPPGKLMILMKAI